MAEADTSSKAAEAATDLTEVVERIFTKFLFKVELKGRLPICSDEADFSCDLLPLQKINRSITCCFSPAYRWKYPYKGSALDKSNFRKSGLRQHENIITATINKT